MLDSQLQHGSSGRRRVSVVAYELAMYYVRSVGGLEGHGKVGLSLMFVLWSVMLSMLCCCHKMCRAVCAVTTLSALYDKEAAAATVLLTGCFHHASIASSPGELLKSAHQWLQKAREEARCFAKASWGPVAGT